VDRENLLEFAGFRYLKLAGGLTAASVLAYVLEAPRTVPNGGTWLGYTLGTLGALLIVWLSLFGIRKRAYRASLGSVRGWLSAHVWLGLAVVVIGTLHCGFQFGWNIHTLAWALMLLVVLSGIWGVGVYLRNPELLGRRAGGLSITQRLEALAQLDAESRQLTTDMDPRFGTLIEASARAPLPRGLRGRLGAPRNCPTDAAVSALHAASLAGGSRAVRELYAVQLRRQQQLGNLREYLRLKAWTEIWLLFHVPLSMALLVALTAHVISVFVYW